jgi:hypothetical protein
VLGENPRTSLVIAVLTGVLLILLLWNEFTRISPEPFSEAESVSSDPMASTPSPQQPPSDLPEPSPMATEPTDGEQAATDDRAVDELPPTALNVFADPVLSYLLDRYLDREATGVRVCAHLTDLNTPPPSSASEFRRWLSSFAVRNTPDDPFVESVLPLIGYFVRVPYMDSVLERILAHRTTGDSAYVTAPLFESQLSMAAAEVIRHRPVLDRMAQRSYHLFVVARVAQLQPLLANDSRTVALCEDLAAAVAADFDRPREEFAQLDSELRDEKAEVLGFLAEVGISPERVSYDFNLVNSVSATITQNNVGITAPWVEQTFGGGFTIVNPPNRNGDSSADQGRSAE